MPKKQKPILTEQEQTEARLEMMRKMSGILSEHFDTVQIICLKLEPNGTTSRYNHGSGLLHARVQGCESWIGQCHTSDVM